MTTTTSSANSGIANNMQTGQHSMSTPGNAPGAPTGQSDQQQQQQQLMSPQAGQQVQMGQALTGAFPQTILQSPMGQAQVQYVVVNQHGQQMLQPNYSFPGMAMPAQQQQAGQAYIITGPGGLQAKQGGQQPQFMASSPASSQSAGKAVSQAPTYTLTSSGIVAQSGGAPPGQTYMIAPQMGGSPTLQATPQSIMPNSSLPSHIKAEPGKPLPPGQPTSVNPQAQQVGSHQPMILQPGMRYVNQAVPGQAFMTNNGQIIIGAPGSQDGQAPASQLMFSPQSLQMQSHPQAGNLQPTMATQQLPPGLTTSMQPVTMTSSSSGGTTMVRPPMAYASQPPAGKTQISRAPPTLLPATSTATNPTSRSTTSTAFMTQPSPKSKQKMSPRTTTQHTLASKGGLSATSAATKSILNTIRNQSVSSVSPPILSSTLPPGNPSAVGPPVLQTPLSAPPSQTSNSQPPLLHPMMIPSSMPNSTSASPAYINGGRPTTMVPSLTTTTATKVPILPNNSSHQVRKGFPPPVAAPMEPVAKPMTTPEVNGKRPQECLTHVIDGHVIHESSQPFPLEDDIKSRQRKKTEVTKNLPTSNITTHTTSVASSTLASTRPSSIAPVAPSPNKFENEKKRGPGRPPGSTRQNIEQQRVNNAQVSKNPGAPPIQPASSGGDIVKVSKDGGPMQKKAKTDFEKGPPPLNPVLPAMASMPPASQPSEVKAKYNIDVLTNNPLKWSVTQVCDFVKNLPGCSDYVEDFQLQEIDGQALMLLKADHLMSAMAIKLGPALKICNAIEAMREELKQN